ncbi:Predicted metalloprotease, contains C-terminal PDZ domain [Salinimicrobium sediminis]|uniref:Predicted metalloprotease, contains C-terminal PDZ domain n=1 Tax=Salinimicrobium sediminis TaxID=1343891 RepID=A0A285X766_9FLAO|nr:peptidase M61 [Salinimicrobium sediminis]SOC80249.1 Predicted metalloprotease, contains C-terminal PDZ domain [Salinimicrobium sediminis]
MKKIIYVLALTATILGCKTAQTPVSEKQPIIATLDLVNVQDDKVMVTVDPADITSEEIIFYIPKTVPGTYSTANYGQFAENFRAYDKKGKELTVTSLDENSWKIMDATRLDKISYWMNDSYDVKGEKGIYSMAGTNIKEGENYMLNLHGFIGYFENMTEEPYRLEVVRPDGLFPGSALTVNESTVGAEGHQKDIFSVNRYFEVTDNPIMYATADTATFKAENMEVLLHVYSPNKVYSAQDFKPAMEKMINAQKSFLGEIDDTNKYAILLYLSATPGEGDAGNFGALEHHTSTVVVMPETMAKEALLESLTDIVSHEFFHILTPLGVHSEEVHYFDYNDPKMSQHLWLYEGVTEYFANLFQVNQGLITNQDFYDRMNDKILASKAFDDTMPFTVMSQNILEEEYHDSYYNVYLKGALIGMALDIRLRELSNGERGLLDLMKKLTDKYGKERPFKDEELISVIVELTYPEIREFFEIYVSGTTPIPYNEFFKKVGLELRSGEIPVDYFIKDQATPYITVNAAGEIVVRDDIALSTFFTKTGMQGGDIIKSINGKAYNVQNIYDLISDSVNWKVGEDITITVVRDGNEKILKAKVIEPMSKGLRLVELMNADGEQMELRHSWLKS